jgi:syntaxin 16
MASTSLLNPNRSYAPISTEDPGTSSKGAITVGLPPAWVDVSEEISVNIQRARTKMAELGKAHAKALMPSFGDGKEDQHNIESLTQEITFLLKKSEKQLQRLSASGPSEDSNVRKNVQRSLATDLQLLSMELRKKQSTYLKRLRQQKEDGMDLEMNLSRNRYRPEEDDFGDMLNEHQMSKIKKSEEVSVEREKEIQQASACTTSLFLVVCSSPTFFFFLLQSIIIFFLLRCLCHCPGCRISKRSCSNYEGSFCTCDRSGYNS